MHIRTGKTYPKWLPLPCENLVSDAIILRKADPALVADGVAALREALSVHSGNIEIGKDDPRPTGRISRFSLSDNCPERAARRDTDG